MDLGLKDKVVVITAATGGLGYAIAQEFAAEGARVVIAGRTPAKIEAAVKSLRAATGGDIEGVKADCGKAAEIDALIAGTEGKHGRIDVLINNSGGPKTAAFTELTDKDWLDAFDAKFLPQVRAARAVFPGMVKRKSGRIITIIGIHAHTPHAYAFTAGVVNAALASLTKTLAEVGAPHNVLVNAIHPGFIDTERLAYLARKKASERGQSEAEARKEMFADIPLGRPGTPEDIAAACVFLASKRAGFFSGTFLDIDGGMTKSF